MRNTTKKIQQGTVDYFKSPQFIVEFLEMIDQPLEKERIQKLNEFLEKEKIERHRKAWRKLILG